MNSLTDRSVTNRTEHRVEVSATHVRAELMMVAFEHSFLVSDHPVRMGGSGRGPSPGEILLAGLLASTVLAATRAARELGLPLASAVARGVFRTDLLRAEGPLAAIAYLAQAVRRLELDGPLSAADAARIAARAFADPVGSFLSRPANLDERVALIPSGRERGRVEEVHSVAREMAGKAKTIPMGATQAGVAEANWRISAASLGEDRALVRLSNQTLVAGGGAGPSPEELLLGGLAACTTIYIARNAMLNGIPIDDVTVHVGADRGLTGPVLKSSAITANITEAEFRTLKFCADHCALGEGMLRGMRMIDEHVLVDASVRAGGNPTAALERAAPGPDPALCDDGSCCLPAAAPATAQAA